MLEERIKEWEFDPGRGFKRAVPAMPSTIHKRSFDGSAAGKRMGRSGNYLFELERLNRVGRRGAPIGQRA